MCCYITAGESETLKLQGLEVCLVLKMAVARCPLLSLTPEKPQSLIDVVSRTFGILRTWTLSAWRRSLALIAESSSNFGGFLDATIGSLSGTGSEGLVCEWRCSVDPEWVAGAPRPRAAAALQTLTLGSRARNSYGKSLSWLARVGPVGAFPFLEFAPFRH